MLRKHGEGAVSGGNFSGPSRVITDKRMYEGLSRKPPDENLASSHGARNHGGLSGRSLCGSVGHSRRRPGSRAGRAEHDLDPAAEFFRFALRCAPLHQPLECRSERYLSACPQSKPEEDRSPQV